MTTVTEVSGLSVWPGFGNSARIRTRRVWGSISGAMNVILPLSERLACP